MVSSLTPRGEHQPGNVALIARCPRCNRQCTAVTRTGDSVRVEFFACRHDMRVIVPEDGDVVAAVNAVIAERREGAA